MEELTKDEIIYIEKVMDINASLGIDKILKNIECYNNCKMLETDDSFKKAIFKNVQEIGEAQLITESIRKKLEAMRK